MIELRQSVVFCLRKINDTRAMKTQLFFLFMVASGAVWAGEWIVNPEKVFVHSGSEPLFISDEEDAQRGVASPGTDTDRPQFTRQPQQYLEVLKVIPQSDPQVQRAWLDYKILKSNNE